MKRLIVADASPLIALHEGTCIDVLRLAFDEVVIPEAVYREVYNQRITRAKPRWIKVQSISGAALLARIEEFRNEHFLDRGESEAITLAENLGTMVLLDERAARMICRELRIAHISAYEVCSKLLNAGGLKKKRFDDVLQALRFHGGFVPGPDEQVDIA